MRITLTIIMILCAGLLSQTIKAETWGNSTTAGAGSVAMSSYHIYGVYGYGPSNEGVLDSIGVYAASYFGLEDTIKMAVMIDRGSPGGYLYLVDTTAVFTTTNQSPAWYWEDAVEGQTVYPDSHYVLVAFGGGAYGSGYIQVYLNSSATDSLIYDNTAFGAWPDSVLPGLETDSTLCIQAASTPSGPPPRGRVIVTHIR